MQNVLHSPRREFSGATSGNQHDAPPGTPALTILLQLEGQARAQLTANALEFFIVNETRRLIAYRQAFLLGAGRRPTSPYQVHAASSLSLVERDTPMMRWLEQVVRNIGTGPDVEGPMRVSAEDGPPSLRDGWKEFGGAHALWCPLRHPDQSLLGGLWLDRDRPWQENEIQIVQRLVETYAHAWKALAKPGPFGTWMPPRLVTWLVVAGVLLALCIPVPLSTLAPVKVVAKEPAVVTAPMDGVLAEVLVPPNTMVVEGQTIVRYEDTNVRNQYRVADKQLAVAKAEHRQAVQSGFLDPQRKAEVPLLEAEARLKETERDYAKELLDRVEVKALRSGLLMYTDRADWVGKPVVVGERIMEIADPAQLELRIDLAVNDAMMLQEDADVAVFFDAKPLETYEAKVTHAGYHAEVLPGDQLAYHVTAGLTGPNRTVRIGWQGTAKMYGKQGPLAFLLFRRPLSALRQFVGW